MFDPMTGKPTDFNEIRRSGIEHELSGISKDDLPRKLWTPEDFRAEHRPKTNRLNIMDAWGEPIVNNATAFQFFTERERDRQAHDWHTFYVAAGQYTLRRFRASFLLDEIDGTSFEEGALIAAKICTALTQDEITSGQFETYPVFALQREIVAIQINSIVNMMLRA